MARQEKTKPKRKKSKKSKANIWKKALVRVPISLRGIGYTAAALGTYAAGKSSQRESDKDMARRLRALRGTRGVTFS